MLSGCRAEPARTAAAPGAGQSPLGSQTSACPAALAPLANFHANEHRSNKNETLLSAECPDKAALGETAAETAEREPENAHNGSQAPGRSVKRRGAAAAGRRVAEQRLTWGKRQNPAGTTRPRRSPRPHRYGSGRRGGAGRGGERGRGTPRTRPAPAGGGGPAERGGATREPPAAPATPAPVVPLPGKCLLLSSPVRPA